MDATISSVAIAVIVGLSDSRTPLYI